MNAKLRRVEGTIFMHWCPGCECAHQVPAGRGWTWNADPASPTVEPSLRHSWTQNGVPKQCHYLVQAGKLAFCDDCTHSHKGRTVPIPDWPWPD